MNLHPTIITLVVTIIVAGLCAIGWVCTDNWRWGVATNGTIIGGSVVGVLLLLRFPMTEKGEPQ